MERLTIWNEQTEMAELLDWDTEEWKEFINDFDVTIWSSLVDAFNKLAEYEDLEEQGLIPPCKIGDTVYNYAPRLQDVRNYNKVIVKEITIRKDDTYVFFTNGLGKKLSSLGKTLFLTEEDAKKYDEMIVLRRGVYGQ